jgi:hypothetical protein
MGAVKNSSAIYLTIADGKIVRRFKQPTKDTVTRTTKEGKVVHEEIYDGWNGRIAGIEFRDHKDYGRFVNVMINDGEATAILQMKQGSGYAMAFLKTLPNVDLQTDVKLSPSMKVEGDKKKTSMFINQHGEALKWAYTRDQPNGIPELRNTKPSGCCNYISARGRRWSFLITIKRRRRSAVSISYGTTRLPGADKR